MITQPRERRQKEERNHPQVRPQHVASGVQGACGGDWVCEDEVDGLETGVMVGARNGRGRRMPADGSWMGEKEGRKSCCTGNKRIMDTEESVQNSRAYRYQRSSVQLQDARLQSISGSPSLLDQLYISA